MFYKLPKIKDRPFFWLKNAFFSTLFTLFCCCSGKKAMELTFASYQLCWLADYVHGPLDLGSVLHEQLLTFVFWTRWSYADIVWSVVQTNHARVKTILTRFVPLRKDGCCCCYEIARVSSLVTAGRPWISTLWFGLIFLDLHCLHDI